MSGTHFVTSALLALAVGTSASVQAADVDASLHAELERISHRRIFFGHQSVGVNLLDGVRQLARMAGVPVRIAEIKEAGSMEGAMIGHTFIADNENPLKKLKSFEQAMDTRPASVDIALMKFCFVDFSAETDVQMLFARYSASINNLRVKHPGTTFVHVTAPLTAVEGGLKARAKYLLGYAPLYETMENMRREEYNTLLRKAYQGREPIFDLARVESTAPDGTMEAVKWKGMVVPVMTPEYTSDGGHLNDAGQLRAARELVRILASIPERTAAR